MLTPKGEALAFRIWRFAEPIGWDCTAGEIADAIGSTPMAVGHIAKLKGWGTRLRKTVQELPGRWGEPSILAGADGAETIARYARLAEELPE